MATRLAAAGLRVRTAMVPRLAFAFLLIAACGALPGCGTGEDSDNGAGDQGVTRTAERGPVSVRFTVSPVDLVTAGRATATIEITSEPGTTVPDPDYVELLGEGDRAFEYRVVNRKKLPPEIGDDGTTRSVYRYDIEFVLPGDVELPGVEVRYLDTPATSPAEPSADDETPITETVSTESITVTVRAPAAVASTPEELANIKRLDPVELPGVWDRWWWIAPIGGVLALVLIALLLRRARRQQAETVVVVPAHEWARRAIAALVADELIGHGRVQEFYYRISGIVRGYIERRFDVSAAEMTTEEFLQATADDGRFASDMRNELNRFLVACDMVKYARYEPGEQESDSVLRAAGEFVEQTRKRTEDADAATTAANSAEERAA